MSHEAFREKLLDLAYGELAPREARRVEEHATGCPDCRAALERLRETRRLFGALPREAPERGEGILLAAAREAAERRRPRRALPRWLLGASVVAASLVAVGAVSWRIASMRPGPLARPDATALLGEARTAEATGAEPAPAEAKKPAEGPAAPQGEPRLAAVPSSRPEPPPRGRPTARSAPAEERPARAAREEQRFARPPPAKAAADEEGVGTFGSAPFAPPPASPGAAAPPAAAPAAEAEALRPPPSLDGPAAGRAAPSAARARSAAPARAEAAREPGAPAPAGPSEGVAAFEGSTALRAEVRTFPGCEGEVRRRVEVDAAGRVIRYVREGRIDGRRLRIEHVFGPDGDLEKVTVRDLDRPGVALDPASLGLRLPRHAEEAGADAPPRCGR